MSDETVAVSTEQETVRPVKRLADIRIEAEAPAHCYWSRDLEGMAKGLEGWAREFEEWVRDHRSQDPVSLRVERVYETQCSECGYEWEVADGECTGCGLPVAENEEGETT